MNKKKTVGLICSDTQAKQITDMLSLPNVNIVRLDNMKTRKFSRLIKLFKDIRSIDLLYLGHGTGSFPYAAVIATIFRKKVIIHWIGSDILDYKKSRYKRLIKKTATLHLACSELICSELGDDGIMSSVIPIVPLEMNFELSKLPKKHAVLFYLPTGREDFYGIKYLNYLAEKYGDMDFYVVGNESDIFKQDNVHNLGKINAQAMNELYNKITVLVRIPDHDGLSIMLLEALMRGKQVLYCYDFPFSYAVKNIKEADKVMEKIVSSNPELNIGGRNYVLENYNLAQSKKKIQEVFKNNNII